VANLGGRAGVRVWTDPPELALVNGHVQLKENGYVRTDQAPPTPPCDNDKKDSKNTGLLPKRATVLGATLDGPLQPQLDLVSRIRC
jgi:hypothetical protein